MHLQRLKVALVIVSVAVAAACLTACQPSSASTLTPSATTSGPLVSVTPSPNLDPEQQHLAAAAKRVVDMWRVLDEIDVNPRKPINDLDEYAGGEWVEQQRERIARYRAAGVTTTGMSQISILSSEKSGKDVIVQACADFSEQVVKDDKGKVISGPPYRILHKSTVRQVASWLKVVKDEAVSEC